MATRSQKLVALKSLQLAFGSMFVFPEKFGSPKNFGSPIFSQLENLYPDHSFEVNQILGELLVQMGSEKIVPKTIDLLNVATDPTERMQHLFVLRNAKTGWNEQRRRDYFAALASTNDFIGGAGMKDFLKKIRAEAIAGLTDQERRSLAELLDKPQQTQLVPKPTDRKFIQEWTVKNILDSNDKSAPRDLVRGKRIFNESQCVNCHRCAGDGNFVGPDLTAISRRFNQRDVLTSIIQPSRVIAEKYKSLQVITTDGDSHLGQVVQGGDYRSTQLRLAPDPTNPMKTIEIEKSDIEIQRYSEVSWMPKGLLNTFTRDEILDLLAYLNAPK